MANRTLTIDIKLKDAIAPLSPQTKITMYGELMGVSVTDLSESQIELLFILSLDNAIQSRLNHYAKLHPAKSDR